MPAPDLPPPPQHTITERLLHVWLHVSDVTPRQLLGGVVIVIDALRASVTMTAALHHGAACVVPVLTVEEAREKKREIEEQDRGRTLHNPSLGEGLQEQTRPSPCPLPGGVGGEKNNPPPGPLPLGGGVLLGGERGGVLVEGFDLDNSPLNYTRERVAGRIIVFTTSNGTAALLHAREAAEIIVGSFANLSVVCGRVARDPRPVHILCAGTRDEVSLDDILPAGAMVEKLTAAGRTLPSDDSGRAALAAYRGVLASPGGLVEAMRQSRGGRNLANVGLGSDVDFCSKLDTLPVVPVFDALRGVITL